MTQTGSPLSISPLLLLCICLIAALAGLSACSNQPDTITEEFRRNVKLLEQDEPTFPGLAVDFTPHQTRLIRIVIHSTFDHAAPGIDELETFGPESDDNLALATRGSTAQASSVIEGFPIHRIAHLNNGAYGNDHSWIAASASPQWVQITLSEPSEVNRVVLSRDRSGFFHDRHPRQVEVLLSDDGTSWQSVATKQANADLIHRQHPGLAHEAMLRLPADRLQGETYEDYVQYAFTRERETWRSIPADDHLSPLITDRPASPGGAPYWGRLARMEPLERVLFLFEEMIERLDKKGVDVSAERTKLADFQQTLPIDDQSIALYLQVRTAKRHLFFRDPDLAPAARILFTKRQPFLESHNYSEHLDGLLKPGGGIYSLQIPTDKQGRMRPEQAQINQLFDATAGIARDPVADFEARSIYFAYRPDQPQYNEWESYWHLYRMRSDGSRLEKLTDGPYHDFDPAVLPDGGLAFHSTRCKVRFLCWRPQAYVLYRMQADGSDMRRLSFANLSEWKPTVMQDGRILWTRSEYLDKGADFGHTLWSIRPDGTHPELVFGNNTPNNYSQAHELPGTGELVSTLISHGDHMGPIALIDLRKGPFDTQAITNITPDTRPHYQMSRDHHNTFRDPHPVSDDHFLVAHNPDNHHHWAIYIIDRYGNREFVYADPLISSKRPSVLQPRKRPPVLPQMFDEQLKAHELGQFVVQNVYEGLGDEVQPGQVKYLRVSEEVPSELESLACGQYRSDHEAFMDFYASPVHHVQGPPARYTTRTSNAPAWPLQTNVDWQQQISEIEPALYEVTEPGGWPSYVAKTSHGRVPVSEDGSVSFLAPAGKVLYFHLLDEQYNEIQRMRSVIQLQPGEIRSCVGCHEDRNQPPLPEQTLAMRQRAVPLQKDPWDGKPFDYQKVVQPILSAHCNSCHDGGSTHPLALHGQLDEYSIPASYRSLIEGGFIHHFDFSYAMRHFKAEPLSFGSVKSPLWQMLSEEHHRQVTLSDTEIRAIKTWIDLNAPLWPDYTYLPDRSGPSLRQISGVTVNE